MLTEGLLTGEVRGVAAAWLNAGLPAAVADALALGLPEWDDRLDCWRVALVAAANPGVAVGEIQVDRAGEIRRTPAAGLVEERLKAAIPSGPAAPAGKGGRASRIAFPPIPNKVILGDCRAVLPELPPESVQLVFTSPPYFNAKPECAEYVDYPAYLDFLGEAFAACHSVLAEGRFLVVNVSPVLVRRTARSAASKRLPIPFDLHPILDGCGFEFIDDIIWRKPEGAGWHWGGAGVLPPTASRCNTSRSP